MVKRSLVLALFFVPTILRADIGTNITTPTDIIRIFETAMGHWLTVTESYATELFWALAVLDIAWFGIKLWWNSKGDLSTAMMAVGNKLLIIGMFLALLMNANTWIPAIINSFIQIGKDAGQVPVLTPSFMLMTGFQIFGALLGMAQQVGALWNIATAIGFIVAALIIAAAFLSLTVQFVMAKVDTFLTIGLAHIFIAFGGSTWTAPYVERYFALAVSSGVRLMVLYALIGAGWQLTQTWVQSAMTAAYNPTGVVVAWAIAAAAALFAMVCHYCSKIVSAMLSGTPALTGGDAIAFITPMIGAGIAAGIAAAGIASGGSSTAGARAAGSAAAAASNGISSSPGGSSTPPSRAPSSNGLSNAAASAVLQAASAGARALQSIPHGGSHAAPPHFSGFGH